MKPLLLFLLFFFPLAIAQNGQKELNQLTELTEELTQDIRPMLQAKEQLSQDEINKLKTFHQEFETLLRWMKENGVLTSADTEEIESFLSYVTSRITLNNTKNWITGVIVHKDTDVYSNGKVRKTLSGPSDFNGAFEEEGYNFMFSKESLPLKICLDNSISDNLGEYIEMAVDIWNNSYSKRLGHYIHNGKIGMNTFPHKVFDLQDKSCEKTGNSDISVGMGNEVILEYIDAAGVVASMLREDDNTKIKKSIFIDSSVEELLTKIDILPRYNQIRQESEQHAVLLILHELSHALGIDHEHELKNTIMNARYQCVPLSSKECLMQDNVVADHFLRFYLD